MITVSVYVNGHMEVQVLSTSVYIREDELVFQVELSKPWYSINEDASRYLIETAHLLAPEEQRARLSEGNFTTEFVSSE